MSGRQRTLECYDLLLEQVRRGTPITYGEFAPSLGVAPMGIGSYLMPILLWCRRAGHPELPIIVVNRRTGRPSGPYRQEMITAETARVFAFDWTTLRPSLWDLYEP